MDLIKTVNEYAEGAKKTTEEFKKMFGAMVLETEFEPEHLGLLQNMFGMIEVFNRLATEQAKTIHEINEKLDRLLEKKES